MANIPQMLKRTGDGLFAIDREQRIVFWNRAAQSILGLRESDVLGRPCYDVLRCWDDQGHSVCGPNCRVFRAVARGKEVPSQEMLLRRPDGRYQRCGFSVITMADGEEAARAIVLFRPSRAATAPEAPPPPAASSEEDDVAPAELAIRCFGTFEILARGRPLTGPPLSRNKAGRALRLLIHRRGHKVQRDELAEVLWPEEEPEISRANLKVLIHALRHALEPDLAPRQASRFIGHENGSYFFVTSPDCRIDVDAFLRHVKEGQTQERDNAPEKAQVHYQAAARLYRGEYLAEDLYEDWCSGERERLRELYISVLMALASIYGAQEEYAHAVDCCRRALANDGCRETTYRHLMRYLWWDGRGHEALRVYRNCQAVLERELGVPPLAETTEVYLRIREELSRGNGG
ncbi:MAG: BTAD domain-containing putative transcriptional regulator [Dehalococcoidia bacterium]